MLIALFLTTSQAQTGKWSLQLGIGAASEQNLGDTGLRPLAFGKVSYALKHRLNAYLGMGSFQMLRSNEQWEPIFAFREVRSLSFYHWDLGLGLALIDGARFNLSANAGVTFRVGRQLSADAADYQNGVLSTYYVLDRLHEIGYAASLDGSFKVTEKLRLGVKCEQS